MLWRIAFLACFALAVLLAAAASVTARTAALEQTGATSAISTTEHFDPVAATNAYLAKVPPDKKAKSDAYFEGGYWLILWDFLASSIVLLFAGHRLVRSHARFGEQGHRFKPIHTFIYWASVPGVLRC